MGLNVFDIVTFIIVALTEIWLVGDMVVKMARDNVQIFTKSSPLLFPFLLSIVLGICLIMLSVRLFRDRINMVNENKTEETGESGTGISKLLITFLVILLIYTYFLPVFHFIIATMIFVFIAMVLVNETGQKLINKLLIPVIISITVVPLIYYVFYNIFDVVFP